MHIPACTRHLDKILLTFVARFSTTLAPVLLLPSLQFQPVLGCLPNSRGNGLVQKKQTPLANNPVFFVIFTHSGIILRCSKYHWHVKNDAENTRFYER